MNNKETRTEISPITLNAPRTAVFSCSVDQSTKLSIILQDEMGRSKFQGDYTLEPGDNQITMSLPELSSGQYNAWIDVLGETFIRSLEVEAPAESGIVGKFKQLLNLF